MYRILVFPQIKDINDYYSKMPDFKPLVTLENEEEFGPWMEVNGYSLISMDLSPHPLTEELEYCATVVKDEASLSLEAEMKLEIALELEELEEDTEDCDVPAFVRPVAYTEPSITTKTHTFKSKGTKMKAHQYLAELIKSNPGISRTDVFTNAALRTRFLSKVVVAKIDAGDKLETKRYNRRLNRFIRQIRRDGDVVEVERIGRVAHYTIAAAVQLEIPFDLQTEARNSLVIGNNFDNEELEAASSVNFRSDEEANVNLSFEDLLSTLDNEAVAPVAK